MAKLIKRPFYKSSVYGDGSIETVIDPRRSPLIDSTFRRMGKKARRFQTRNSTRLDGTKNSFVNSESKFLRNPSITTKGKICTVVSPVRTVTCNREITSSSQEKRMEETIRETLRGPRSSDVFERKE